MTTTATLDDVDGTPATQLIPLARISCRAAGRDGKAPHASTLIRWVTKGTRLRDGSRLRLRAIRTPGGWRSCSAWVDDFHDRLTRDRLGVDDEGNAVAPAVTTPSRPSPHLPPPRLRTPRERAEASRRAGDLLQSLGC